MSMRSFFQSGIRVSQQRKKTYIPPTVKRNVATCKDSTAFMNIDCSTLQNSSNEQNMHDGEHMSMSYALLKLVLYLKHQEILNSM